MGNSHPEHAAKLEVKLTERQKQLLRQTWHAHIHDDEYIGFKIFDNMFTESPDVKEGFTHFAEIDVHDEHYNDILHRHGLRVKHEVGKVIEMLDDENELRRQTHQLGFRHYKEYLFKPEYTQVIFEYFLISIKEAIEEDYTEEVETAYKNLFRIIAFHMVNAIST